VVSADWDGELVPTLDGRTDAPAENCPVEVTLAAISGRWTTLVLRNLMTHGPMSFTRLSRSPPSLSVKVLTDRLTELVDRDLVERRVISGFPVWTEYQLTRAGQQLRPLLVELYRTGMALQNHAPKT
jgi:DNA-binding HxlR family transcriptional regulator